MKHTTSVFIPCRQTFLPVCFVLFAMVLMLPAQQPPTGGEIDFTADTAYQPAVRSQADNTTWRVADGVTVTVSSATTTTTSPNGGVFLPSGGKVFTIAPSGSMGTGRVRFINNYTKAQGGVFYLGTNVSLYLTNVDFINNYADNATGGGAIRSASNSGDIRIESSYFQGNHANNGGAIRSYDDITIVSSTFFGNFTTGTATAHGFGGVIDGAQAAKLIQIYDSVFTDNYTGRAGGVVRNAKNGGVAIVDSLFTGNWAGVSGGAINDVNTDVTKYDTLIRVTGTGAAGANPVYYGNRAAATRATTEELWSGTDASPAVARAGGFYYAEANSLLTLDIAEGASLQIGRAADDRAWDSIASADAATGATIKTVGAGSIILHADNSYFQGNVKVDSGSLYLGNPDASLGGVITVSSGALLGGSGTLVTHKQNSSEFAGRTSVTLASGATLAAGSPTASGAEKLSVLGSITADNGATFNFDLFSGNSASNLYANSVTFSGTATINLGLLATGSFVLFEQAGAGFGAADLTKLTLTIDGQADSSRGTALLAVDSGALVVTNTVNNLVMRWTGAEGSNWMRRPSTAEKNWTDSGGSAEDRFFNADRVIFDGEADAASAGNREISIEAGGVVVSDMEVTGTARYVFLGGGGITADADAVGSASFVPSGKLMKRGEGELVFANSVANNFLGGIEIAGGVITFDDGSQLGSGAGGIVFADSGTLRATEKISGVLAGNMTVEAGKTAEIEIDGGGVLVHSGTLASAADSVLRKAGEGALHLQADSSGNVGGVALNAGAIILADSGAKLGGNITVALGAIIGGVGEAGQNGSLKIASGGIIEAGVDSSQSGTLTVRNLEMSGGAVLKVDLFQEADGAYQKSDRVYEAGTSAISGANIIDLTSFASGTFNLGNLTGLAANGIVTLSGMMLPTGGRLSAELTNASGTLEMVTTSDQSRVMTWKGGANSTWNLAQTNWSDDGSVNQFSYGDRIIFDDTSAAASREIFIDAGEVRVADMTVGGNADYTFTGGGIHASADNVQPDSGGVTHIVGTGKLVKTGGGTLTLANGQNTFTRVELGGGVLAVGNGNQLTTTGTGAGIVFTGDATLRATDDLSLDNQISVTSGNTGAVDSNGHDMVLQSVYVGANAAFVKQGEGVATIEQRLSLPDTSALIVREGTVRAGADYVFSTYEGASIVVDAGAKIDLAGHSLLMRGLSGSGEVDVAGGYLIYNVDSASSVDTFAGSLTGSGTIRKVGDGKWKLSGASSFDGEFLLSAGELGLAHNDALGTSSLTIAPAAGGLSVELDGLLVANDIATGANTLAIETNGHGAEFSGKITGNQLVVEGTGTLTLSGNNTINLKINNARTIAKRTESIGDVVDISDGSVLEFRDVSSGQVRGSLQGDRVLFTSSTLSLTGTNTLRAFVVSANSRITADAAGSLGGISVDATVEASGWLKIMQPGTQAHNMNVAGGALVFAPTSAEGIGSLAISGTLNFINGGEIRLDGIVPTGIYTAAVAYGGIPSMPAYDPHQGGMFMVADILNGDTLQITAYNKALEPGKDIVVGFDAMTASMRAVYSHVSEELLTPLINTDAQGSRKSFWFRGIGTFGDYDDDGDRLGYTDKTYAGILGYDWISENDFMMGGYFGHSSTRLETTNNATTDMDLPYFGIYGAKRMGGLYIAGDFTMGFGCADTERREDHNNIVTGSYDLNSIGGSLELGYMLPLFAKGGIKPSIGIHYMNLSFRDYKESGQGAVRLDDMNATSLQGIIRIDANRALAMPWGLPGMVNLSIGWTHNLDDSQTDAWASLVDYPNARFQIRGDDYDSDGVLMGVGVRMLLTKKILFSLSYDFDHVPFGPRDKNNSRHTFSSMIRVSW